MKKMMTISYEVGDKLYMNITNKCPCNCTFCIRNNADGAYGSDSLWLEHDPDIDEIKAEIDKRDIEKYNEIIYCGYGEPTSRLNELIASAKYLKSIENCPPLRLNTNGLSDLINERETANEIGELFDVVSVINIFRQITLHFFRPFNQTNTIIQGLFHTYFKNFFRRFKSV